MKKKLMTKNGEFPHLPVVLCYDCVESELFAKFAVNLFSPKINDFKTARNIQPSQEMAAYSASTNTYINVEGEWRKMFDVVKMQMQSVNFRTVVLLEICKSDFFCAGISKYLSLGI